MVGRYPACIGYEEYPTHFDYEEDYVLPNTPLNVPPNALPNPPIHAPPNAPIPSQLNTLCYLWTNSLIPVPPTNIGEGSSSGFMANLSSLEHEI